MFGSDIDVHKPEKGYRFYIGVREVITSGRGWNRELQESRISILYLR